MPIPTSSKTPAIDSPSFSSSKRSPAPPAGDLSFSYKHKVQFESKGRDPNMYQVKLGRRPWRLDLLLLLFFYQEKKRRSWGQKDLSNETFFSFLEKRKEAKETQALYRRRGSLAGYLENSWKSQFSRMTDLQTCTRSNLASIPDALIFFCFFFSIKRRKEDPEARKILHQKNKISCTLKISAYSIPAKIFLRFFREKFVAIQNSYTLAAA